MTDAPAPQLTDYPAAVGVVLGVLLTAVLLFMSGRFDPTNGVLTLSILVVISFIGIVMFSMLFAIPTQRDERCGGWRHDGGVRRDRGLLAGPRERQFMSLIESPRRHLIIVLIGGVGAGFLRWLALALRLWRGPLRHRRSSASS